MNEENWLQLMARLGFDDNKQMFAKLTELYSQKGRFYHNQHHIDAVLKHLYQHKTLAQDYNTLEVALWFHDAVYNVFSSSNEKKSAEMAKKFLQVNGAANEFSDNVYQLIMATEHNTNLSENDAKLIVDIDLTILGSSPQHYQNFERSIRQEYKWIPSPIYRKKRKQLLNGFIARDRIYHHQDFFDRFEKPARDNIQAAIKEL